jgi:hypothetical protein
VAGGDKPCQFCRVLRSYFRALTIGWVQYIALRCRTVARLKREREQKGGNRRGHSKAPCIPVREPIYRRPDPLIYSQYYLLAQGIGVTWNNPDIVLTRGGVTVPSSSLEPDTDYQIIARIWNGSTDAPAVHMPVRFFYLDFGIAMPVVPIGETFVNLPVKGAPGHPTFAAMPWRTPATAGHYCLLVQLLWADDANPFNNLGQENLDVAPLNSPRAVRTFPVRNEAREQRTLRLEADAYAIPAARDPCDSDDWGEDPKLTHDEIERQRRRLRARHARQLFPVPAGWTVDIAPRELTLGPGEQQNVTVAVDAPAGFNGTQAINVNAFHGERLIGGVTLHVTGDANA